MRRIVVAVALLLGVLVVPGAQGVPGLEGLEASTAEAAPNDIVALIVEGTGFGHGRGMSQWGAYGWAVDHGWSWQQILDHYYGGTTLGTVPAGHRIKVRLLGHDGAAIVGVTSGSGNVTAGGVTARSLYAKEIDNDQFEIYGTSSVACPTAAVLVVPDGPLQLGATGDGVRQIQTFLNVFAGESLAVDGQWGAQTDGAVRRWQAAQNLNNNGVWDGDDAARARQQIGSGGSVTWTKRATVAGPVTFTTAKGETSSAGPAEVLGVCSNTGRVTHYRGQLVLHNASGNANWLVNDVKVEDYLRGVVPKEVAASWGNAGSGKGANALRAQAVAARSYGLAQNRYAPYASTCDSMSCQVYGGSATRQAASGTATNVEHSLTDAAIVATANHVRRRNGQIVSTEFSASNGPRTAGYTFPVVDDTGGDGTTRNPNHRWTRVIDADAVAARYGLGALTSASMAEAASAVNRNYDGIWFNDVLLNGATRIEAWDFRGHFGLPSPGFTIRVVTRDTSTKAFGFIGDSVGNSIAGSPTAEFVTLIDGTFPSATLNMRDGRCVAHSCAGAGSNGAEIAASLPMNLDLVVVELGYNQVSSAGFAAEVDTMMDALTARGVRQVAWVNLATAPDTGWRTTYAQRNAALLAATSRWPTLTILDWNSASTTSEWPRWFADHAHLTSTGQARFATWLREQVSILAPGNPFQAKVSSGQTLSFKIAGVDGVPANASAVALNVTAVDPIGWGYLTVWPCGSPRPEASNVNFTTAGAVEPNSVLAKVDSTGRICVYTHATTHVLVDVAGWFSGGYESMTPRRTVDTRSGIGAPRARVGPAAPLRVKVAGVAGVPAGATAVAMNVTAVGPDGWGYLTVWPCGSPRPEASNVNFTTAGAVEPNTVLAKVDGTGEVCIFASSPTDVLVDVAGWFTSGYESISPHRIVDTRNAIGAPTAKITPTAPLRVKVTGVAGVPTNATAVALNVTAVDPAGWGYLTVWPCGSPMPNASNVNFVAAGAVEPNSVLAKVDGTGEVCIFTSSPAHVLVDVAGWFTSGYEAMSPVRTVDTRNGIGTS